MMDSLATLPAVTRRNLLKGGGALVIGFSLAGKAAAQFGPPMGPDLKQIDSWIAIHADNSATVLIGFVELGQGCTTTLPMIAADELDLAMEQVRTIAHETEVTPYQGGTYSSSAIAHGRPQVQQAAAEARAELLRRASIRLGTPVELLDVERGVVSVSGLSGKSVTYGELIGDEPFEMAFTGKAKPKDPSQYKIIGQPAERKDIPAKVMGGYAYVQHVRLPGMLHARIVRPRGQGASGSPPKVASVDETSIASVPGAKLVRQGDFLAVAAPEEWNAVRGARMLKVAWEIGETLPGNTELYRNMRQHETADKAVLETGDAASALAGAAHKAHFASETPYQSHAPMAPNCAVANVGGGKAMVYAPSQDIYALRTALAATLGMKADTITVEYQPSAGTYGHSLYDDVALGAALISQQLGAPVRLQYERADEHGWDMCGPAHIGKVEAGCSADGKLVGYSYDGWQHSWSFTETNDQLARGVPARSWPMGPARSVNPRSCGGMYAIANRRLTDHALPSEDYLRAAWLRSPLDLAFAFTSEQAIDDLAHQLDVDPVEFRQRNISDPRWRDVLDAAAKGLGWEPRPAHATPGESDVVTGRGIGLGTHLTGWGGAAAEVEVNRTSGVVRVKRLAGAMDSGCAVNPNVVEAQIMGQQVQAVGRMLHEEVSFDTRAVTSLDWTGYKVARFSDCPQITPIVIQRLEEPSSGAGEEVMAATAAAIANAFFDATGRRMTTFPFTPERVKAALA